MGDQDEKAALMKTSTVKSLGNVMQSKDVLSRMKVRKTSYGFGGVPGIRPVERTSQVAIEYKRPMMIFMPTYQLEPFLKFSLDDVTELINIVLDELWIGHVYHVTESPALAMRLATELMRRIKSIGYNRYRIIAMATIGQKRAQSYNNSISFIWDHERDQYCEIHRECTTNFIQVTVFGIYLD